MSGFHEPWLARLEARVARGAGPDGELLDHMEGCAGCRAEWVAMRSTAARLGAAAAILPSVDLAEGLRSQVRSNVMAARRAGPTASRAQGRGRLLGLLGLTGLAAAAAIGVLMLRTPTLAPSLDVALAGTELASGARATALIVVTAGGATMTLDAQGLPASEAGEFYELWWVDGQKRHVSCGSFRVGSDGQVRDLAFMAAVDLARLRVVEITQELDDGDPLPGPHVASGVAGP